MRFCRQVYVASRKIPDAYRGFPTEKSELFPDRQTNGEFPILAD